MSDFQVAMVVLSLLVAILGLAVVSRSRRPERPVLTDRQSTDAIGADVSQLKAEMTRHDVRLGEVEHHLAQLRTMLGALPSKDAVNALEVKITEVRGRVDLTHEIAIRSSRALERIESFLMKGLQ